MDKIFYVNTCTTEDNQEIDLIQLMGEPEVYIILLNGELKKIITREHNCVGFSSDQTYDLACARFDYYAEPSDWVCEAGDYERALYA